MPIDIHTETSASRGGWPEIEPSLIEDGRPAVPSFPLDVLPQPWRGWVADAAHGAGAPEDYVAQSLLAAVAGLCGAGVRAQVTAAWSEPLVLWQALVGAPSSGKTSALETDSPAARHGRETAATGQRRSKDRGSRPRVRGAGRSRQSQPGRRSIVARRSVRLARRSRPRRQEQGGWSRLASGRLVRAGPRGL